jgi:acyl-coenzyme A synthetase/AMP-(fatty) acid ligase
MMIVTTHFPSMSGSVWIKGSPVSLDDGGPTSQPYDASAASLFATVGGIEVIEAAARLFPEKVAVDDGVLQLTYAQFIDRVYGLAQRLHTTTAPGTTVCSLVPNTGVAPIIVMACALTGRLLVPIDASHPLDRQAAIFAESGAQAVLLAHGEVVDESFIPASLPRLLVDALIETQAARPTHPYDPSRPLFVSFTSGSTGRPKGVVSGGRYGAAAIGQFIDMFHLGPSDVILGLASLSTGGARDAFAALGAGASIRILDIRAAGVMEALKVLDRDKITVLSFIPSALRMILGIEGAAQAFRHLRVLDLHGERILASDIELFRRTLPPTCHISITMGSVEAGAVFSWFVRDDQIDGSLVPVGYVMPGRSVALLGDDGLPVADGEVGELFVRGAMAMGAWRSGARTQGPFLPDPDDPESSIYPMGDLMRRRADGLFEYVDRKDRRVKIRGLWADLGEIEVAIRSMDSVFDVAVIAAAEPSAAERVCAFIVMKTGATPPSLGAVRRAVAEQTAEHMAPEDVVVLETIPRLANFKPDMVRLKALATAHRE